MKTIAKLALGGLMLAGAAAATTAPASAGVAVGVNIGVPGVAVGYGYGYGNVCARPYWVRPAWCGGYPVYGAPLFVDGGWYRGPVYYRYTGGARYFWIHDRWLVDQGAFHRGYAGWYRGASWHEDHDWYAGHDRWQDHHDWSGNHQGWHEQDAGGQQEHGGWQR
jgi:hypothetical protein